MSASDDDPVGLVATTILATRGADGPGEVSVAIRGGHETFIASSDAPIAAGEPVLIVEVRPGRQVTVVPWDRSIA